MFNANLIKGELKQLVRSAKSASIKFESMTTEVEAEDEPDMDGPTTLKALKEKSSFSSIPVIFLTAKVQAQKVEEYKTMGALGVISNPFDPLLSHLIPHQN